MTDKKEYNKPDLDRLGIFKEMTYLEGYAPIQTVSNVVSRPQYKGKQVMTSCTKRKTGTQDGYFDKEYSRVFEGEGYADPVRIRRLQRLDQIKRIIGPGFKYTSPTKKQSGKGSNYGTFVDYDKPLEYFSSKPKDSAKSMPRKKNLYTNPSKKGTGYGYPNVTIGKLPPYFLEEEYEALKTEPQAIKKPEKLSFEPYRSGIFQQQFFDPNPYAVGKESSPPKTEDEEQIRQTIDRPFLPTSPAKKDGGMKAGCLDKFPEYVSEPYPKVDNVSRGVQKHLNSENKMFRPVPGQKPYPIKSIIIKNVERKVTPQNFAAIKGVVYCHK